MNQPTPDTVDLPAFSPAPDLSSCLEELQTLCLLARRQAPPSSPALCRYLYQIELRLRWLQSRMHSLGLVPLNSRRLALFQQSLRSPPPSQQ